MMKEWNEMPKIDAVSKIATQKPTNWFESLQDKEKTTEFQ